MPTQFRKDINGLRAIAVIAVVLFHFNAAWMPGGFAGVDVFFVISGFLMTGIIFRGIEQENFSILKFYVARANRIIPALALLCMVLLVFGWFYLTPLDYSALGKHVGSSMGFLSNFTYWLEAGYFDTASHGKWLLHTWSLSAEWQFYMIYPLVLVAMRKFMPVKVMKATVLIGTVLGFIFCVIATYTWPNAAYYLLPTRAWEMMMGGVAYLYPIVLQEQRKKILEWFGLLLIIGSYFLISKENPWPGSLAFFPVFGAFLLIQAQRNDSFITGNVVSQKIGAWSYSIYLWHWPLVVGIYYFSLNEIFIYLGILLSLLLGYLSNKYIEKLKFRNDFGSIFGYFKCKPVYMVILCFSAGFFVHKNLPFIYDIPSGIYSGMIINKNTDNNGVYTWAKHVEFDKKPSFTEDMHKVLIIGDSQAGDFINILSAVGINQNVDIVSRIVKKDCGAFNIENEEFSKMLDASPHIINSLDEAACRESIAIIREDNAVIDADIIILAMSWQNAYIPYILKSISNLRIKNREAEVYLIGYKGFSESVPSMIYQAYKQNINLNEYSFSKISSKHLDQQNTFVDSQNKLDFKYINIISALCENDECSLLSSEGLPYYYDKSHLTRIGAKDLGRYLKLLGGLSSTLFEPGGY
jgi:peptidoglycan/LPS O-acetylase OafA/YrhL